jgi:hypothetical protein
VHTHVLTCTYDFNLQAGIKVMSMTLNELNYAPEIASQMLKKQQVNLLKSRHKHTPIASTNTSIDTDTTRCSPLRAP